MALTATLEGIARGSEPGQLRVTVQYRDTGTGWDREVALMFTPPMSSTAQQIRDALIAFVTADGQRYRDQIAAWQALRSVIGNSIDIP